MDKEHRVSVYDMVKELNLKEVTPEINSKEVYIEQAEINRPALQLAGFFENFAQNRVQIIGKAEHLFIEEVEKDVENAKNIYKRFIGAGIPVIVVSNNSHDRVSEALKFLNLEFIPLCFALQFWFDAGNSWKYWLTIILVAIASGISIAWRKDNNC